MSQQNTQAMPVTAGQRKQIIRIIDDAFPDTKWIEKFIDRLSLNKDEAQQLIESGNALHEIRKHLDKSVRILIKPPCSRSQFWEQRNHPYRSGYREARPVVEQISILRHFFQSRGSINWELNDIQKELIAQPKPHNSEGYFAVVFHESMIHYVIIDHETGEVVESDLGNTPDLLIFDQSAPVTLALNALRKQREGRVDGSYVGKLGLSDYRRSKVSAQKMKQLWEFQGCPTGILIIPAQLGIEHWGETISRARKTIRGAEFPLDAYETLQMMLTHENRLCDSGDAEIIMSGAECLKTHGTFEYTLSLSFYCDSIQLHCSDPVPAPATFGHISGFLP